MKIVRVRWRDAFFDYDSHDGTREREDFIVQTVGFLVARDDLFVSIASERLPDGDGFRAVTRIPISVIVAGETLAAS